MCVGGGGGEHLQHFLDGGGKAKKILIGTVVNKNSEKRYFVADISDFVKPPPPSPPPSPWVHHRLTRT